MKLGHFEIYSVLDGYFRLDGGAMFGRVPREVWEKTNPPDRQNRILLALRCLLIKTGKRNILIDTGIGDIDDKRFILRYGIARKLNLDYSLAELGLSPKDIDIVVNTHLHFDHCGGNIRREGGKIIPRFSKYIIQRGEWEDAKVADPLTRASYLQECLPAGNCKLTEFVTGEKIEIERGITLIKTGGHTRHHQIVKIESEGKIALYLGDLVPTVSHLNYPFVMAYDVEPMETVKKKMEILPEAAGNKTLLVFEHDPLVTATFIKIEDSKIKIKQTVDL